MGHTPVGATAALAAVGGYAALYRLGQTWGATGEERQQPLAGDELLPDARAWTTHAITIAAPAHAVWPWLVQMGWGRAGWYTYRWVDRLLFPANGPSANRILPEHQRLREGDQVPDGPPAADCWFSVERLEPDRLLVLRSTRHLPLSWRQRGLAMDWIWSWHLDEPIGGCTRVVQRNRMRLHPGGSSGRSWARSSRRTSSWPAATCAACSGGPKNRQARGHPPGHWPNSGVPTGNQRCQTSTLLSAGGGAA
jgi:hypothetical protein